MGNWDAPVAKVLLPKDYSEVSRWEAEEADYLAKYGILFESVKGHNPNYAPSRSTFLESIRRALTRSASAGRLADPESGTRYAELRASGEINPDLDPTINPELNPGLNRKLEPGLNPAMARASGRDEEEGEIQAVKSGEIVEEGGYEGERRGKKVGELGDDAVLGEESGIVDPAGVRVKEKQGLSKLIAWLRQIYFIISIAVLVRTGL